jgi:hypothetical protein
VHNIIAGSYLVREVFSFVRWQKHFRRFGVDNVPSKADHTMHCPLETRGFPWLPALSWVALKLLSYWSDSQLVTCNTSLPK